MSGERANLISVERGIFGHQDAEGNIHIVARTIVTEYGKAKEESHTISELFIALLGIFIKTTLLTIGWLTGLVIPIAMIAIGSRFIDKCPEERMIPIILIVGGVFAVILYVLGWFQKPGNGESGSERKSPCHCCIVLIYMFLAVWLIVGCVYVYRIYKPDFHDIKCDRVLYTFSFWLLNTFFIIAAVVFVFIFCGMCVACCS